MMAETPEMFQQLKPVVTGHFRGVGWREKTFASRTSRNIESRTPRLVFLESSVTRQFLDSTEEFVMQKKSRPLKKLSTLQKSCRPIKKVVGTSKKLSTSQKSRPLKKVVDP